MTPRFIFMALFTIVVISFRYDMTKNKKMTKNNNNNLGKSLPNSDSERKGGNNIDISISDFNAETSKDQNYNSKFIGKLITKNEIDMDKDYYGNPIHILYKRETNYKNKDETKSITEQTEYILQTEYPIQDSIINDNNKIKVIMLEKCPKVMVIYGKIHMDDSYECTIESNGITYTGKHKIFPGHWYGYINYKCSQCEDILVSKVECNPCGVYCPENQFIKNCKHVGFPFVSGVLSVLLPMSLLMFIYFRFNAKFYNYIKKCITSRNEKKRLKKLSKFEYYLLSILDNESFKRFVISGDHEIDNNKDREYITPLVPDYETIASDNSTKTKIFRKTAIKDQSDAKIKMNNEITFEQLNEVINGLKTQIINFTSTTEDTGDNSLSNHANNIQDYYYVQHKKRLLNEQKYELEEDVKNSLNIITNPNSEAVKKILTIDSSSDTSPDSNNIDRTFPTDSPTISTDSKSDSDDLTCTPRSMREMNISDHEDLDDNYMMLLDGKYKNKVDEIAKLRLKLSNLKTARLSNRNKLLNNNENLLEHEENSDALKDNKKSGNKIYKTKYGQTINNMLTITACLFLFLAPNVEACSNNLYINSLGKVCDKTGCKDINNYLMPFSYQDTLCFKLLSGDILRISMLSLNEELIYLRQYSTSSYTYERESMWQCRYWNNDCTYDGRCTRQGTNNIYSNSVKGNHTSIHGYGCLDTGIQCETYCAGVTGACTFYHWWINRVTHGKKTDIYKLIEKKWSVNIRFIINNMTTDYNFDNTQTTNIFKVDKKYEINELPITVGSVTYHSNIPPSNLMLNMNTLYDIDASPLGHPIQGLIGDYQYQNDDTSETIVWNQYHCNAVACNLDCISPEPALDKFERTINKKVIPEYVISNDHNKIVTKTSAKGNIMLLFGNIDISNLMVERAHCKVEIEMTFGCTGCDVLPYFVYKSLNIKESGLMKYTSNCSFTLPMIPCSYKSMKFEFKDNNEYCEIYIVNTNQTINIHVDYRFLGGLLTTKTIGDNFDFSKSSYLQILTDDNYLNGVAFTIVSGVTISFITTIIIKIIKAWCCVKMVNDVEKGVN